MMAMINLCLSLVAIWSLPSVVSQSGALKPWTCRLIEDIDWFGAIIISVALGILLYVLAMVSSSYRRASGPQNIALLTVSCVLLAAFPCWMHYQVKRGKPALIPNRLWKRAAFTSICVSVFFCWASLNGIEYFITLYGVLPTSRGSFRSSNFDPLPCTRRNGDRSQHCHGLPYLSRRSPHSRCRFCSNYYGCSDSYMATVEVGENYWLRPFWALLLSPVNPDVLFTVSNLVILDTFPAEIQSLAGGVFNEVSQFGNSVGLAVTASIAASVTEHSGLEEHRAALMEGYRASFWTIFAATAIVVVISFFGLKKGGTVGKKED
ncbi:uncharacterized protein BDCG_16889 [Blastomyces dermatitidis ER-3]|uniref:Uncharacterized protein n=2 Tax=Ajellomyces dermatitidis (strain ER-3 / ATCC MYA-2586) TaxID=559297 RepID=A0ABX2VV86_AJEDR|nr:uncharacterized protein BDCG_16889 [Blastomyces dermatitidis ER-3]OAT01072.1 hypothetical protein BDCG_16889 [Blastomyces dermatitidis ER-3]